MKHSAHKLLLLLTILSLLTACGPQDPVAEDATSRSVTHPIATLEVEMLASTAGKVAGADVPAKTGGAIELRDKILVAIPSGGLQSDQPVFLKELGEKPQAAEGSLYLPGKAFEIESEQDVFARPIQITLYYDESRLPPGMTEQEVFAVFLYAGEWHRAYGQVDTVSNTITVDVVHASVWTWAVDKLANAVGAIEALFGVSDPVDVPMTIAEAEVLVEKRRREFDDAVSVFELAQEEFEEELALEAEDGAVTLSLHYVADQFIEEAAKHAVGKQTVALKFGEAVVGFVGLVEGGIHLFKSSFHSGELISEMVKVEQAYDRLCESEAKLWLLKNPAATTMPPELAESLRRTSPEETVSEPALPESPQGASSDPIVPEVSSPPSLASKIVFVSQPEYETSPEIFIMNADGSGRTRLTFNNEAKGSPAEAADFNPTLSPDGGYVAFVSGRDGNYEIYRMRVDGSDVLRLTHDTSRGDPLAEDAQPSWAPDGRQITFAAKHTGNWDIYVMNADGSNIRNLTQNPSYEDSSPAWSPDGRSIAFASGRARMQERDIYVMNVDGSGLTNITNRPNDLNTDPAWSPDGRKIAFSSRRDGQFEIYVVYADGSALTRLSNTAEWGLASVKDPTWSPDGKQIAFTGRDDSDQTDIYIVNANGTGLTRLTRNAGYTDYEPSWALVGGDIPGDTPIEEAAAEPTPVSHNPTSTPRKPTPTPEPASPAPYVLVHEGIDIKGRACSDCHGVGIPTYIVPSGVTWDVIAAMFDVPLSIILETNGFSGKQLPPIGYELVIPDPGEFDRNDPISTPAPLPASGPPRIAYFRHDDPARGGDVEIWLMDPDGANGTQLTSNQFIEYNLAWSPDGTQIAFETQHNGIWIINVDGSGPRQLVKRAAQPAWSPDGNRIAYYDGDFRIHVVSVDGSQDNLLTGPGNFSPVWSPDASKIAFLSEKIVDRKHVFVMHEDGSGRILVGDEDSTGEGLPSWSPDGKKLVFHSQYGKRLDITVANVDGSGRVSLTSDESGRSLEPVWSPDGSRIAYRLVDDEKHDNIMVMAPDGSNKTRLLNSAEQGWEVIRYIRWTSDARQLLFSARVGKSDWDIYVIDADGRNLEKLTSGKRDFHDPVMQPIPASLLLPSAPRNPTSTPAPETSDNPIVGSWAWQNSFDHVWYVYQFFSGGDFRVVTEENPDYRAEGTYRLLDDHILGLTYTQSTAYMSGLGVEQTWEFEITNRQVEFQGKTQTRTVLVLLHSRIDDQTFIRLD